MKVSKTGLSVCFRRSLCGSSVSKIIQQYRTESLSDLSLRSSSRSKASLLCSAAFLFVPFDLRAPKLIKQGIHSVPASLTLTNYFYLSPALLTASESSFNFVTSFDTFLCFNAKEHSH